MIHRVPWDEYFMKLAHLASTRSTCMRRSVGAVVVKNHNVISTGYNGAPASTPHCDAVGCLRELHNVPSGERHEMCRGAHAEQNAIAQAAKNGTSIDGATIYCTNMLCVICAKLAINAGIKRIVYDQGYGPDNLSADMLAAAGILVDQLTPSS